MEAMACGCEGEREQGFKNFGNISSTWLLRDGRKEGRKGGSAYGRTDVADVVIAVADVVDVVEVAQPTIDVDPVAVYVVGAIKPPGLASLLSLEWTISIDHGICTHNS